MALRNLAGKLRIPAAAALRPPSGPRVSPPAVSRFLASRSSQVEQGSQGAKVLHEKAGSFYEKVIVLSSAASVIFMTCVAAYVLDVDDIKGSRKFSV